MTSSDVTGLFSKLCSEVEQAQDRSAQAYMRDFSLYSNSALMAGSELTNFETWGKKFGIYYAWAKSEQKRLESDCALAATKTSSSVGLEQHAMFDIPSSMWHAQATRLVPADQTYHWPLYSINGIDRRVDSWVGAQDGGRLRFPDLDHDPFYDTNLFDATSPDVALSLKAGGMQAFDVDRGFWDVSAAARSQLGSPVGNKELSDRLIKITRILLGYKVEIRMTCVDGKKGQLSDALAGSGGEKILGMTTDRCTVHNEDGQVVVAIAPSGFQTVLAVLGREI
ncbi:hypothetical protein DER46DRAFT_655454 [Fusarium sp. MPI-SDFR-AT-0072]|nr:hypothetical protein DER46DRAFT_655454 [Fusarium sp. MPI-SDFR-AT-0072]